MVVLGVASSAYESRLDTTREGIANLARLVKNASLGVESASIPETFAMAGGPASHSRPCPELSEAVLSEVRPLGGRPSLELVERVLLLPQPLWVSASR